MKSGITVIAEERARQINIEGYTKEHDLLHVNGELANFACCYAIYPKTINASLMTLTLKPANWELTLGHNSPEGRIRDLAKAGALIAAEIDRLQGE